MIYGILRSAQEINYMPKLTVQLVTWNGAKYMPHLFDSLRKQVSTDWELVILDNASSDDTVGRIQTELKKGLPVAHTLVQSEENIGFAGGHNRLYQEHSDSEYLLLLNQDIYLEPGCIHDLITYMNSHEQVAAISPRLMRWDFASLHERTSNLNDSFTDYVDALGLKVFRSRRVVEWKTGERWRDIQGEYGSETLGVFGVSGAVPCLRRNALDAVAFADGTFFDESYGSYKEDVDLAYRLRSAGYCSVVLLDTVAYHDRSAAGPTALSDKAAMVNKKTQSEWVKYHSYKNHIATLFKNEYLSNAIRDFFPILWYECKKFVWYLLFDRRILLGLKDIHWKQVVTRRIQIVRKRTVLAKQIRIWWT